MHLTLAAGTETGYRNLVRVSTMAHRNFRYKPRLDFADLADLAEHGHTEGLIVATGCRSGPVIRTLLTRGEAAAADMVKALAGWFPELYVELMNHGIDAEGVSDDEIVDGLWQVAYDAGLPVAVTADSHYVDCADKRLHDAMKELLTWSEDPADGRFSGEGYHLVDRRWLAGFMEPKYLDAGIDGLHDLLDAHQLRIPELDTFTARVPDVTFSGDPQHELEERVVAELEVLVDGMSKARRGRYFDRLFAELEVIGEVGMAGYLLLVALITDWMRDNDIWYYARGSAAGSLVVYLLRITNVDPVQLSIRMDRFLSGDRTSLADIDLDIESIDPKDPTDPRARVIEMVRSRFFVRQVATYGKYRLDEDDDGGQKGSLRVRYFATQRKYRAVDDKEQIPEADWNTLKELAALKLVSSTGTHAAGFVVADDDAILQTLPLVRIGDTDRLVCGFDKDDLEPLGLPKMDLLGSKTLAALRIACTLIDPEHRWMEFFDSIPDDDKETLRLTGSGDTVGIFQLEGWAQRRGCQELAPRRTIDLIHAQALFRPAVAPEFRARYLRRRRKEEPTPAMHPDIWSELAESHGVAIFQEQMVGVLRNLGMEKHALTRMLKAVKASGLDALEKARAAVAAEMPAIVELARAHDWSAADVAWLERALAEYGAGYSFGKAHSAVYGLVAYRTAWLRVHEPLAFWTGMLVAYTGHKNAKKVDVEKMYVRAARDDGMRVVAPHVNASGVDYTADPQRNEIRKGLVSIKYVGRKAAAEVVAKAPFASLRDLGERCVPGKVTGAKKLAVGTRPPECGERSVVAWLHREKALDGLPDDHERPAEAGGP